MKTILFQGDSITDTGRARDNDSAIGGGYPFNVRAKLGFEQPTEFSFINRGISGNRIVDLYARIKSDIINLKPDYMSILIGVNDVWHELAHKNGVDAAKFERIYDMLLSEVKEALPHLKLMILEPYVLNCPAREAEYDAFYKEVRLRAEASKRIAEKHGAVFIPLQEKLEAATAAVGDGTYYAYDGIHPTAYGHELIAREWLSAFEQLA